MMRIEKRRKKASALRLRFSQSLASLRQRLSRLDRALDDPAFWQNDEAFDLIAALDDLGFEVGRDSRLGFLELRPLIAGVGKELLQERIHACQGRKKQNAAIAILDIGGVNDGVQQQTLRIYENMALLALDLLARIISRWIDAGPPFCALDALAVDDRGGRAGFRSPCSRHST